MTFGILLTRWSIRLALLMFAAVLIARCAGQIRHHRSPAWRSVWTLGWLAFLVHVLSAFQYFHHWSHRHAIDVTAERTEQLIGWRFGEGLYFSYAFLALWGIDVLWWWLGGDARYWGFPRIALTIQSYLAFIAFNGAVVFEAGPVRWGGVAATAVLIAVMVRSVLRRRAGTEVGDVEMTA
ncbi:MAG: hypothetical protein FJ295_09155 [Planctomycetes bacterium]|nr:hypothetical protein [Planctomycetota bacterium]